VIEHLLLVLKDLLNQLYPAATGKVLPKRQRIEKQTEHTIAINGFLATIGHQTR
jgi:hypothetical protein